MGFGGFLVYTIMEGQDRPDRPNSTWHWTSEQRTDARTVLEQAQGRSMPDGEGRPGIQLKEQSDGTLVVSARPPAAADFSNEKAQRP